MSNPIVSQTPGYFSPINQTFSEDDQQRLVQHTKIQRDNARYINLREIAIYQIIEQQTGQQWYNTSAPEIYRYGFRKVITFAGLAPGSTNTIPHGITGVRQFTLANGFAVTTTGTMQIPLPYSSVTANANVEIDVDNTNLYIKVGASSFTISSGFVCLEYLKQ